jgi:hypothetical protein
MKKSKLLDFRIEIIAVWISSRDPDRETLKEGATTLPHLSGGEFVGRFLFYFSLT